LTRAVGTKAVALNDRKYSPTTAALPPRQWPKFISNHGVAGSHTPRLRNQT
jgi:hypothetical protein